MNSTPRRVLPVPTAPLTRIVLARGIPPRRISSRPRIPVRTKPSFAINHQPFDEYFGLKWSGWASSSRRCVFQGVKTAKVLPIISEVAHALTRHERNSLIAEVSTRVSRRHARVRPLQTLLLEVGITV